jgi:CspA family cold shock protein
MGRGSDHRDRRRRFGDQPADPWGGDFAPPPSFDRPPMRPARMPVASGPETQATVKWFNGEKGFGFVQLLDGSGEAFLHIRAVEAAGHQVLEPGTTLTVRVGQGQKGAQVTEILSVDTSTAEPEPRRGPRPMGDRGDRGDRGPPRSSPAPFNSADLSDAPEVAGSVKWYDPVKGFGFVAVDGEPKDLFVHRSVVGRAGLGELAPGQNVLVRIVEGRKGREVGAIRVE